MIFVWYLLLTRILVCASNRSVNVLVVVDSADLNSFLPCVKSLQQHNPPPDVLFARYIFVDDSDAPEVLHYLNYLCTSYPHYVCTSAKPLRGCTASLNKGIAVANSLPPVHAYSILHSDIIVTAYWLDNLYEVLMQSDDVFAVGPVSNNAGLQSLFIAPTELFYWRGRYTSPLLPPGQSPDTLSEYIQGLSPRIYPTPLLHGFCYLLRPSAFDIFGTYDEVHFPMGMGEDYDLFLRATGSRMLVVSYVYVHHNNMHPSVALDIVEASTEYLLLRYESTLNTISDYMHQDTSLSSLRSSVASLTASNTTNTNRAVLFVSHIAHASLNVIVSQVVAFNRLGVKAALSIPMSSDHIDTLTYMFAKYSALAVYPDALVIHGGNAMYPFAISQELIDLSGSYDIVVATSAFVVEALNRISESHPHVLPVYIYYDFEPWQLINTQRILYSSLKMHGYVLRTMQAGQVVRYAYGSWLQRTIVSEVVNAVEPQVISVGIDHDYLMSREACYEKENKHFTMDLDGDVMYFVTSMYPRDGENSRLAALDMVLRLAHAYGSLVHVTVMGCTLEDAMDLFSELVARDEQKQYVETHLVLEYISQQQRIALIPDLSTTDRRNLFHRSDMYFEMSVWSSGTYALEAMASNCLVMLPNTGVCNDVCTVHQACLCHDPHDAIGYFVKLVVTLVDESARLCIMQNSKNVVSRYDTTFVAIELLSKLESARQEWRQSVLQI